MFNLVSILIALIVLVFTVLGLIPFFGWLNWIGLVIGAVGVLFGLISRHRSGLWLNIILMAIAGFRLFIGGGFF